ncbi:CDP-glycerol glycerophosphotransferase family protein [Bacillus sp. B6(2022)]|nr:CDP-glycerol glycerophosphotransferase family protein [Bacillus sp. B6(2022)]
MARQWCFEKFGLEDASNHHRSSRDLQRFKRVYASFDYIVTGSDHMREIFKTSFGVKDDRFLPTGVPFTDAYYDERPISFQTDIFPKGKKCCCMRRPTGTLQWTVLSYLFLKNNCIES